MYRVAAEANGLRLHTTEMTFRRRHSFDPIARGVPFPSRLARMCQTLAVVVAAAFLLSACALNRPRYEEWDAVTGKRTKRLSVPSVAIWPGTTSLEKQRVSVGKTMVIGTQGLTEDSGSTNIAATIEALTKLLQALKP